MTPERWRQVTAVFHAALTRTESARARYLDQVCAGDPALRAEVDAMLAVPSESASRAAIPLKISATTTSQLEPGTLIGPYRVECLIGAGGMGEVYRARDTRLRRDVAIKLLPSAFIANADRLVRFEREARVLASLNHPHIAAIYGVEDAPTEAGTQVRALILEYVDGDTLTERIAHRGSRGLPIKEALDIARQIADALDAAHEKGVVHRDLKPANIKITPQGVVKVLDFGLAKLEGGGDKGANGVTELPTITLNDTREGLIVGTAAYMSPEQARGQAVDKRTDIWAFGCVLYEMLSARPAFPGATISDTIAAILEREPNWPALPERTPAIIRRLLQRCLEKDPSRRLRDAGDARIEVEEAFAGAVASPVSEPRRGRERLTWMALTGLLLLTTLGLAAVVSFQRAPADTRAYRTSILPPEDITFSSQTVPESRFALSPDGRRLAFVAGAPNQPRRLWVRPLDAFTAQALAGTEDAIGAFWSPDGRFLAFFAQGKLKKIDASGGPPLTLVDSVPSSTGAGAWSRDDVILFHFTSGGPLYRVSASGGAPAPVTKLDAERGELAHIYPFFLPDRRHFLYFARATTTGGPTGDGAVRVGSLDSKEESKLLLQGGANAKYAQGHLLFLRESTLMAQPFDAGRLKLTGDAAPLVDRVVIGGPSGRAGAFAVSETGVLAYQRSGEDVRSQLVWFDRKGNQLATVGDKEDQVGLELSPDGRRAAVSILDPARNTRDIWIYEIARGLRTRFTFDPADELELVWSPDGSRIVFASRRKGLLDLHQRASSGADTEDVVLADKLDKYPMSWSADGRFITYYNGGQSSPRTGRDLWVLPLFANRKPTTFLQTASHEMSGRFSPDGRWLAYASDESGRFEVYVRPFPGPGGQWQVSAGGGTEPRWRRDGKELFYLDADNKLTAATVNGQGSAFEVGVVRPLFEVRPRIALYLNHLAPNYDVAADGQRFLVNTVVEQTTPIDVVVNWSEELKRLVPTK